MVRSVLQRVVLMGLFQSLSALGSGRPGGLRLGVITPGPAQPRSPM